LEGGRLAVLALLRVGALLLARLARLVRLALLALTAALLVLLLLLRRAALLVLLLVLVGHGGVLQWARRCRRRFTNLGEAVTVPDP
jgi:hypothetical protein